MDSRIFEKGTGNEMNKFWKNYCEKLPNGERPDLNSRVENQLELLMVNFALNHRQLHEPLYQLAKNGPVWDGNVISKSCRDSLLDAGACAKVLVRGEDGFNACTYLGRELLRVFDWLHGSHETPQETGE